MTPTNQLRFVEREETFDGFSLDDQPAAVVARAMNRLKAALAEPVQEPQRQPLSDEEIAVMRTSIPKTVPFLEALVLYTRAVERKHGIGGKDE